MNEDLAIITVIHEHYDVYLEFLASIQKQSNRNFHLFIVDVSKNRKSIDVGATPSSIIAADNKGYADGVNNGVKAAQKKGYKYFCVMNYDTYFEKDFVEKILVSVKKNPATIIGGKIYYASGYEYHKDRYSKEDLGKVIWYASGNLVWEHALTPHVGVDKVDKGQFDKKQPTDFITGCLMCFDSTVIEKVGFWDPSYFLYYEDADFCVRAKRKGIPLLYDPSIVLWHKVSQITEGSGSAFHKKYQEKNRLIFGLKYAPIRTKIHLVKNFLFEKIYKR